MNTTAKILIAGLIGLIIGLTVALVVAVSRPAQQQHQQSSAEPRATSSQPAGEHLSAQAAPVSTSVPSSAEVRYVGNSRSLKFHRADCEWAQKISERNKVTFRDRAEAVTQGYAPCYVCKP
ncbi:MAG: hypothetical protein NZ739_01065 [Verrucomicrobiae bacterium]|nr:hypothetical protein [Verrucomicrobiae bacterium]MCX7721752.1 hypothetical protein [Verrucomicrobiae bacterium]MDW7980727.1 hypothetical protein [Verrucomicrobiales bacterium]